MSIVTHFIDHDNYCIYNNINNNNSNNYNNNIKTNIFKLCFFKFIYFILFTHTFI